MNNSASFHALPIEISQYCLSLCHPLDVIRFSKTSRSAYGLVNNRDSDDDEYLWRELYLNYPFDPPPNIIDWRFDLQRRVKAQLAVSGTTTSAETIETFISVTKTARPLREKGRLGTTESLDTLWLESLLQQSPGFVQRVVYDVEHRDSLYAKFRCYLASPPVNALTMTKRTASRAFVYCLQNYSQSNAWGPYRLDGLGNVNWIHLECILNVILFNLRELPPAWMATLPPVGLQAIRAYSAPETDPDSSDWAGISGTWRRYVSFLDYSDFRDFNVNYSGGLPFFADNPGLREATRLIDIKLNLVTEPDKMQFRHVFEISPGSSSHESYPPLYFAGTSRGISGNEAKVEGLVRMGDDGIVRWQFCDQSSTYDGLTEWSSSGVQVGNVASAMGILGTWTTADHDHTDPIGPFWLWKVDTDTAPSLLDNL